MTPLNKMQSVEPSQKETQDEAEVVRCRPKKAGRAESLPE